MGDTILFRLPDTLKRKILGDWLGHVVDICKIESALCSEHNRGHLYEVLNHEDFCLLATDDPSIQVKPKPSMNWLYESTVPVRSLLIPRDYDATAFYNYLLDLGKFVTHLDCLYIEDPLIGSEQHLFWKVYARGKCNQYDSASEDEIEEDGDDQGQERKDGEEGEQDDTSPLELEEILALCPNLTSITNLRTAPLTDESLSLIADSCPMLRTLKIWHGGPSNNLTDEGGWMQLLQPLQHLHTLDLYYCTGLGDITMQKVFAGPLSKQLLDLRLSYCINFSAAALEAFASALEVNRASPSLPRLRNLTIDNISFKAEKGIPSVVSKARHLKTLYCRCNSAAVLHDIVTSLAEEGNELECIEFYNGGSDVNVYDDDDLIELVRKCTRLKRLSLARWDGLTQTGLVAAVTLIRERAARNEGEALESLSLSACRGVNSAEAMKALVSSFSSLPQLPPSSTLHSHLPLRELNLKGQCVDDGLLQAIACSPLSSSLSHLYLYDCKSVTDSGVHALVNSCKDTMKSLKLQNAAKITDEAVVHIAENATRLESLYLCDCRRISDIGVRALANAVSNNLRRLDFEANDKITSAGILALCEDTERLKRLEFINLEECNKVENEVRAMLISRRVQVCDVEYFL